MPSASPSQLYHLRTRDIVDDLTAISKLVGTACTVLEVGCGTGRVLSWLSDHNPSIKQLIGIEIDNDKSVLAKGMLSEKHGVSIVTQDFQSFVSTSSFDVVLFAFNVFAEFLTPRERLAALERSQELLAPGGRIIIILFAHDFTDWSDRERTHSRTLSDQELGEWTVAIRCIRNSLRQITDCKVVYRNSFGDEIDDEYTMALITRNELLVSYLAKNLQLHKEYGSYQFEDVTDSSEVFIHVLEKIAS